MASSRAPGQTRRVAVAALLLVIALASRQARAWWLFPAEQDSATAAASTSQPQQQQQQQQQRAAGEARAVAQFDMDGVKGTFKFAQSAPEKPTRVEYDLRGLKGNNKLYHVHVRPVPGQQHGHQQHAQAAAANSNSSNNNQLMCGDKATGGHLNPFNVTQKLPPKSAPLDKYEIGDLSGKHGPLLELAGQQDRYVGAYTDERLPMAGEHSIVGRSIVIHKNDGARWVCASIVPTSA